jgi:hypothetical protein
MPWALRMFPTVESAHVGQGTLDAIVAPVGILFGHAEDQIYDLLPHPWPTRLLLSLG